MSVVGIKDVAIRAGVSPKTVSRVINGEQGVRPDKREAVLKAVKEMNYRPNAFARSLRSSRSYLLGLLIDDPTSGYAASVQLGALLRCREKSYHLVVEPVDRSRSNWANELADALKTLQLDGVMLTPPLCDDSKVLAVIEGEDLPYVRISPSGDDERSGLVRMNDREAAAEVTRHLISLGHRRIGFIKGDPAHSASHLRFEGFRNELASAGIGLAEEMIREGDFSFRSGVAAAEELLTLEDRPTAVFASNDDMALGVQVVAMKHHLTVPDDLAIAGFDDAPTASLAYPQLTTIHQPKAGMAEAAVDILVDPEYRQNKLDRDYHRTLDYTLKIRGSTDPERA